MYSHLPKVLHSVCGRSVLERVLRATLGLKPAKIVVVIGHGGELVSAELERVSKIAKVKFEIVVQDRQGGTGHAVQTALPVLDPKISQVLIIPADTILLTTETLKQLSDKKFAQSVRFISVKHPEPTGFGRVLRSPAGAVSAIVEEKDASPEQRKIAEINSAIYLASYDFLKRALSALKPNNVQGELYLTDIVAIAEGECSGSVEAILIDDYTQVAGANTRFEMSTLEKQRRLEINRRHMDAGVSFENPDAAYIDEDVVIGKDCFIGAGTRLRGKTKLAESVVLEGDNLIVDSEIGSNTKIKIGCAIESSKIGEKCAIGPFAHLRPGTVVENDVKVGNFVETKKAHLHEGVRAGHLSYIGDAIVEANVNIGAGTITCNYDGVNKHQTVIEKGAFIGSNTSLVAPVKIGAGAVTGAGSAITKDVPAGALALERNKQTVIENWASKRRKK